MPPRSDRSSSTRREAWLRSGAALAALPSPLALAALLFATPLAAQNVDGNDVDMGMIERKIERIEPRSGAPGTPVRVTTADMPVITPIRVGIGAPQAGFEAYEELLTGDEGEFDVTIPVPDWASWDRVHLFIVFDIYFRPIALSDAFHVTNQDGLVRRSGRVRRANGCSILRDIDGIDYALTGSALDQLGGVASTTRVTLEARVLAEPRCGLENVLEIVDVVEAGAGR